MERKKIDSLVISLCNEIDNLKEEVEYWKEKYDQAIEDQNKERHDNLIRVQKDVVNALMFAMHVKDDDEGNLIIEKDSRSKLANNWK